mgnify:CR=1 FL=1
MSSLNKAFIFMLGAAVGAVTTYVVVKKKFEKKADEEIESVKEALGKRRKCEREKEEENNSTTIYEVADKELKERLDSLGYNTAASDPRDDPKEFRIVHCNEEGAIDMREPYVIPPEEFGENDYQTETLYLYADDVLTDDMDNPIEDVDGMVGEDSLTHFGEYEDDSVFVRNDVLKIDFEILLDSRPYSEVVKDR